MGSGRVRFLLSFFIIVIVLLLLDRTLFHAFVFRVENRSGWDSFRWYNFEYHLRELERERERKTAGPPLVLVVGSSIAKYSVQKRLLEEAIRKRLGEPVQVELLVHASMMPVDLRHYASRIRRLRPRLVLYLTNPADLDLERYLPPWEAGPAYSRLSHLHYLDIRIPLLLFYPGSYALEHLERLGVQRALSLLSREWLEALRFRDRWFDAVKFNLTAGRGVLRSYLYYQGEPLREGVWREGHTGACLTFPASYLDEEGGITLQVMKELRKAKEFHMEFYGTEGPGAGELPFAEARAPRLCALPSGAKLLSRFRPARHGWQRVRTGATGEERWIYMRLSHVTRDGEPLEAGPGSPVHLGRGVRLPGNFGRSEPVRNDVFVRRRSLEDVRLSLLDDGAYIRDFQRRVQPDTWREPAYRYLWQFNHLRLAKYFLLWYRFDSSLPQVRELERFLSRLEGIPLLLVNNPENPLTLEEYDDSRWYRGYLAYYRSLERSHPGSFSFVDLRREGRMQMFLDAHHLTYDGMRRMAFRYGTLVAGALRGCSPSLDDASRCTEKSRRTQQESHP